MRAVTACAVIAALLCASLTGAGAEARATQRAGAASSGAGVGTAVTDMFGDVFWYKVKGQDCRLTCRSQRYNRKPLAEVVSGVGGTICAVTNVTDSGEIIRNVGVKRNNPRVCQLAIEVRGTLEFNPVAVSSGYECACLPRKGYVWARPAEYYAWECPPGYHQVVYEGSAYGFDKSICRVRVKTKAAQHMHAGGSYFDACVVYTPLSGRNASVYQMNALSGFSVLCSVISQGTAE